VSEFIAMDVCDDTHRLTQRALGDPMTVYIVYRCNARLGHGMKAGSKKAIWLFWMNLSGKKIGVQGVGQVGKYLNWIVIANEGAESDDLADIFSGKLMEWQKVYGAQSSWSKWIYVILRDGNLCPLCLGAYY